MKEILVLESLYGYEFTLGNDEIIYSHVEGPIPEKQEVLPLFKAISDKRSQAIEYLKSRSQPVDVAEHLWVAAEKAQVSAIQADLIGDNQMAQNGWHRSLRLFAASAEAFGILDPHIPWDEWIAFYTAKNGSTSGDTGKV